MKLKLLPIFILFVALMGCEKEELTAIKPEFTVASQKILAGESVTFVDQSSGQPSSWSWEFEGGSPAKSDLSGPTVIYNQPGTYAVTLEIKNSKTSAIERKTGFITVDYRDVTADFTVSSTAIKQDETVTFTDASAGMPTKWAWEFKSGTTVINSDQQNPAVKFTVPGVYSVTLVASNPKGSATVIKNNLISVLDITSVEADFTSDFNATYTGGSIKFSDKSVGTATAWNWTFEGATTSTSTQQNPTVTYANAGRYKIKLVASNTAKSSTVERSGYIVVVPGSGLTAFYPLDGSINDAGPSKLISTPFGTVAFDSADRNNLVGRTGGFGSTGGFTVADNPAMNFGTGDYSVSVWIKTATTASAMVWQESGGKGSGDNQTWVRIRGTATNLTSFSTEDAAGGSTINLTSAANGSVAETNNNAWHHIVTTRQGLITTIYIDGVKVTDRSSTVGVKTTSNEGLFKIGMQETATGFTNRFNGLIDDLIIYKKALTQAEVTALKNL
ncbi:LamG domain-containing protein [Pedobacter namyangjuensis]|uniref:LamG domain-containing protein n=1 Tax=Pedobacter namyangjuensis TaxID=600626 RepID=UPI000DE23C9E|nr:PKD domain-containing protein [Pedobacter namyangjuensis]